MPRYVYAAQTLISLVHMVEGCALADQEHALHQRALDMLNAVWQTEVKSWAIDGTPVLDEPSLEDVKSAVRQTNIRQRTAKFWMLVMSELDSNVSLTANYYDDGRVSLNIKTHRSVLGYLYMLDAVGKGQRLS